jgi:DNA-binding MarR family transcriptional regulator
MPAGPPSDFPLHKALSRHTGFLISRLGWFAQKRFAERIAKVGLTPRAWGALNVLEQEGVITQHALCRSMGMDPSSMVAIIDELEAQELVERKRNPQDRRAHALHITDKGRSTLTNARNLAMQAQNELLGPLNREEREQLHSLLLRLVINAQQVRKTELGAVERRGSGPDADEHAPAV